MLYTQSDPGYNWVWGWVFRFFSVKEKDCTAPDAKKVAAKFIKVIVYKWHEH